VVLDHCIVESRMTLEPGTQYKGEAGKIKIVTD
jgi:hypothetical protein